MKHNGYKKIVIIGATSAIAEQCARLWVKEPKIHLILVGRNLIKTQQIAKDLQIRNPQSVITTEETNFTDPVIIQRFVEHIVAAGDVDIVLIAHGSLPEQSMCQNDLQSTFNALTINGTSPALFAEAFAGQMQKVNKGTLAIISSVAGERGRKSNYVYGAAKGMITRYVQGLQHRLAKTAVKVVLIKPGPTDTPMTAHLNNKKGLACVDTVAKQIVQGINSQKPIIYTPKKWALIMTVVRQIPAFIFNKMEI